MLAVAVFAEWKMSIYRVKNNYSCQVDEDKILKTLKYLVFILSYSLPLGISNWICLIYFSAPSWGAPAGLWATAGYHPASGMVLVLSASPWCPLTPGGSPCVSPSGSALPSAPPPICPSLSPSASLSVSPSGSNLASPSVSSPASGVADVSDEGGTIQQHR